MRTTPGDPHKAELKKDVRKSIDDLDSQKGVRHQLLRKLADIDAEELALLDLDGHAIAKDIKVKLIDPLKELEVSIPPMHTKDVEAARAKYDDLVKLIDETLQPARHASQAIKVMLSDKRNECRKEYMKKKYFVDMTAWRMTENGMGENAARAIALAWQRLKQPEPPTGDALPEPEAPSFMDSAATDLDPDKVCVFNMAGLRETSMPAIVAALPQAHKDMVDKRVKDVTKIVHKKNWRSGLVPLACFDIGDGDDILGLKDGFQKDEGAAAWLLGLTPFQWRYLPSDFPLQGFGQVIASHTKELAIMVFNFEPLFSAGICPIDLADHLESASGQAFLRDEAFVFFLAAQSSCWVPFGFGAMACFCSEKKPEEKSKAPEPVAFATIATIFSPKNAARLDPMLWKNLYSWNKAVLDKTPNQKASKIRADLLHRFDLAVTTARSTT